MSISLDLLMALFVLLNQRLCSHSGKLVFIVPKSQMVILCGAVSGLNNHFALSLLKVLELGWGHDMYNLFSQ